jgi:TolA-binding protein
MFWAVFFSLHLATSTEAEIQATRALQLEVEVQKLSKENKKLKTQVKELSKLVKNATCTPRETTQTSPQTDILPTLKIKAERLPAPKSKDEEKTLYERALQAVDSENWDEGLLRMEHFVKYFPESTMADNAIFWMAQIYLQKNETELARAELQRLKQLYPKSDRSAQAKLILKDLPDHRGGNP